MLLALVFCIKKKKGKEKIARTSSGSLPRGITNGEFPFCAFLFPDLFSDCVVCFFVKPSLL